MRYGASTFIWVSPFSNKTLDLLDRIKEFGFDLIEICIEDPDTIDPSAIRPRVTSLDLGVTVCGAFGPDRDLSSEDESRFATTDCRTSAGVSKSLRTSAARLSRGRCMRRLAILVFSLTTPGAPNGTDPFLG